MVSDLDSMPISGSWARYFAPVERQDVCVCVGPSLSLSLPPPPPPHRSVRWNRPEGLAPPRDFGAESIRQIHEHDIIKLFSSIVMDYNHMLILFDVKSELPAVAEKVAQSALEIHRAFRKHFGPALSSARSRTACYKAVSAQGWGGDDGGGSTELPQTLSARRASGIA